MKASVPEWMEQARCKDLAIEGVYDNTDLFFQRENAAKGEIFDSKRGKQICMSCTVKPQCLAYALEYGMQGVWGGTDDAERVTIAESREER